MSFAVMALTAGLGTRLAPYTNSMAKPAIPFLGVPLVRHALRHIHSLSVERLVANLHYRPDDVRSALQNFGDYPIYFSDEIAKIRGSGGAVWHARSLLESFENVLLVNGDEVLLPMDVDFLREVYDIHLRDKNLATIVTMENPEVGRKFGGVYVDQSSKVIQFSTSAIAGLKGLHYTGYLFLRRDVLKYLSPILEEENILYHTLTKAIAHNERIFAQKISAHWFEVGSPDGFKSATAACIELLEQNAQSDWAQETIRFLVSEQPFKNFVELDDPSLLRRVVAFQNSICARR